MRYLSQCPECQAIYQLSLSQINISDGRVKCARCHSVFNALSHFIIDPLQTEPQPKAKFARPKVLLLPEQDAADNTPRSKYYQYVTQYMHSHVDGSKLDLYTYLNNLNRINPRPNDSSKPEALWQGFGSSKQAKPRLQLRPKLSTCVLLVVLLMLIFCLSVCTQMIKG